MNTGLISAVSLLHCSEQAALASHCLALPGYPYVSAITLAPDEDGVPLTVISTLAEHTRQLQADAHACLLLADATLPADRTLRITLLSDAMPCERTPARRQRFLRYQPGAVDYIDFDDFSFWRFVPKRARFVAGFGRMGWFDGAELLRPALPFEAEAIAGLTGQGWHVLGVDSGGCDLRLLDLRRRITFERPPQDVNEVLAAVAAGGAAAE
ncbi:pyridoxamine 5'-phosphate oxidase family protein [Microvirgula aerodenitrificans]|uniref:HugZ family pyridoxamine 5'-phosphate oxidase n=1 Tax=Microvirgula aerodenitrificans TaxID=57480 RepID=UPI0028E1AB49|nr:pyridoxamine 5'-phosphate oxidase family protein [Microvirgula aerodenitrificans]